MALHAAIKGKLMSVIGDEVIFYLGMNLYFDVIAPLLALIFHPRFSSFSLTLITETSPLFSGHMRWIPLGRYRGNKQKQTPKFHGR